MPLSYAALACGDDHAWVDATIHPATERTETCLKCAATRTVPFEEAEDGEKETD